MSNQLTTKRGIESALYVCPDAAVATSRVVRERVGADAVTPFQGTGLPFAGRIGTDFGADVHTMSLVQFVQPFPGDRARRPPS